MDIEVHRAGRTYYPQTTVLLNIPHRELESFFGRPDWEIIVAAKFLGLQEVKGRGLSDWGSNTQESNSNSSGISGSQLDAILAGGASPEEIVARLRQAQEQRRNRDAADQGLGETLRERTGVPASVWKDAGTELLEAITPFENAAPELVKRASNDPEARGFIRQLGFEEIALVQDYTIINATFGYSRAEYAPDECWLNPFPPDRAFDGKLPIFVDKVQADALLITLDPTRVLRWLRLNGQNPNVPAGANEDLSAKSYFVQLLHGTSLYHSIGSDQSELRMVFGLLHTLSHLCVRQASLLCGLEKTSLSEYIIPKALTFAMYCNHRFGATIGALTALFEQSLQLWLNGIRDTRVCVYDPLCADHGATCHACTHLAETSCRFFNLNLSRAFVFGGADTKAGEIRYGYFDLPP
jgi:hypothetical protein